MSVSSSLNFLIVSLEEAKTRFGQELRRFSKTRNLGDRQLKALYATQAADDEDLRDEKNRDPSRLFQVKTTSILSSIYDLVCSTSQGATLQEGDLQTFIEKASDVEKYILMKYVARDDGCISYLPASYGQVLKDETMPQFGAF